MASTEIETVGAGGDKAKIGLAIALALGGVVAYYLLGKQGALAQWGALLVALAAALGVFFASEGGKQFLAFGREAWREAQKVVWPARKESLQMTGYVFAFVLIMAIFLWVTDKTLEWALYDLILGWKK